MHDKLGDLILTNDIRLMAKLEKYVAKLKKSVVVQKVAIGIEKAYFMSLSYLNLYLSRAQ